MEWVSILLWTPLWEGEGGREEEEGLRSPENNSKECGHCSVSCIEQGQLPLTASCVHSVSVSCNAPGFD